MKNKFLQILLCCFLGTILQVSGQATDNFINVNSGVKYSYLGSYDVARLNTILTKDQAKFSEYKITYPAAKNPVKLYRVVYNSVIPELGNKPTVASGLIAVPDNGKSTMPMLSYQHGTVFGKTDVPYFPEESFETRLMIANFAGQGYVMIAADNFGKALSPEHDAYQLKASTQQADLDMLMASKEVLKALKINSSGLFLSGWSMGSWSTLVFQEKLQSLNIPVKAVSVACNPTDVFALINCWVHRPSPIDAIWLPGILAVQLNAYAIYYDLPGLPQAAIKAEYVQPCRDYYDNKITFNEFYAKTPHNVNDLLTTEFKESSSLGLNRYWQILQDNNAYRFRSLSPIHCYYGEIDEAIPEYIGILPKGYQEITGGAIVNVISAGKTGDHRGTFKFSMLDEKKWFDSLVDE